ncbi:MAG: bZIP transcription factor, partial [Cyclobacteriaceae bacterium]
TRLTVNGNIRARKLKLEIANWPDYVFAPEYSLPPLAEVKQYIQAQGRLPGFESAFHYQQDGIPLAETTRLLLEKVEELTLYLIRCEEKIDALEKEISTLQSKEKPE